MVEKATIDCYDEEEQHTGLATLVEDNLEVPFATTVLGIRVTVTGPDRVIGLDLYVNWSRPMRHRYQHGFSTPHPEMNAAFWLISARRPTQSASRPNAVTMSCPEQDDPRLRSSAAGQGWSPTKAIARVSGTPSISRLVIVAARAPRVPFDRSLSAMANTAP
jgi:hypothetical protein